MDRQIVYPAQIPLDSDQLNAQRNTLVGIGHLAGMAYGQNTVAAGGFACTPGGGLAITIAPGSLLAAGVVDGTAYGTLPASASTLVRQYISRDPVTLEVPCAGATCIVYVTALTQDTDATVLPFYNAADPAVTYAGAGNSGNAAPTVRRDVAQIGIGASVPTGAHPLWTITVPAGATAITAGMIAQASGAPFYDTIPQLQAAKQDALGFTPVQQGGGFDQVAGKVYLGRDTTYPGLRYSYVNTSDNIATGGYLLSTYGTELNGAYGALGDLSYDGSHRLVYQSYSMNGAYYTAALYSDVTAETVRASNAEANLVSGTSGMVSGDAQGTGLHYSSTGRMYASYTGGGGFLAWYSDVTAEATARTVAVTAETVRASNVEASLISGTAGMASGDQQGTELHYSGSGHMYAGYTGGGGFLAWYADVTAEATARAAAVTAEATARANADAKLVSGVWNPTDAQVAGLVFSGGNTSKLSAVSVAGLYYTIAQKSDLPVVSVTSSGSPGMVAVTRSSGSRMAARPADTASA
ncbi:hypothetical protein [Komagataeibacter kakiaceti]|uniref:hypothetical protein n=1 Tax=Komagataeibacter kakiaceti TaxID=943261 RepID=UPI0004724DFC|nr:hypothetical protein [Komagataeibacter kakiaceti]